MINQHNMSASPTPHPIHDLTEIMIQVPPYVAIYLFKEYGPGPFQLTKPGNFRELNASFLYQGVLPLEQICPKIVTPESIINLKILLNNSAFHNVAVATAIEKMGTYYSFFYMEFWQAMISFTRGQQVLTGVSRRDSVKNFLAWYEIPEDILSFDSAIRGIQRFLDKRNYRKLKDCPDFSGGDSPDWLHA
jgi:hypothetical protein